MSEPFSPTPGQPAGRPSYGSGAPLTPPEERNWAMAAHLSSFLAAYAALGLIGPLVVFLVMGPRSAFVRRHSVEALNFNISVLIYVLVSVVLMLVLIGFLTLIAVGVLYLVTTIQATIAASNGREYRYPLTIRFVH